ncbi:MAG: hypothetical protein DMD66_08315 [Gemmatimonadetes bacterium]|nr:MAG: hypothetical protein DMD66_08315 [Gemmatimonadota bacterium]
MERRARRRAGRGARAARLVSRAREIADPDSARVPDWPRAHRRRFDVAAHPSAGARHHAVRSNGGEGRRRAAEVLTLLALATAGCGHPRSVPPITVQQQSYGRFEPVVAYLRSQVDSAFPGGVVAVGYRDSLVLLAAVGHYAAGDRRPVTPETIYDLASLTKVIALTTECILLVDQGKIDLDAPVQRYLPEFRGPMKDQVTIRHLLTHSAGLAADLPLWDSTRTRAAALAMVDTSPLLSPPGTRFVYSDLSAIVLMQVVERITGRPFDRLLADDVFTPIDMTATRFVPPKTWRDQIAPSEVDTFFRHRLLIGEVHDESAGMRGCSRTLRTWRALRRGCLLRVPGGRRRGMASA